MLWPAVLSCLKVGDYWKVFVFYAIIYLFNLSLLNFILLVLSVIYLFKLEAPSVVMTTLTNRSLQNNSKLLSDFGWIWHGAEEI